MGEEKVILTAVGQYDGHTTKKNRLLELKFKFTYDERVSMAKAIMFVGQNIAVIVKPPGKKALRIGTFNFQNLNIDRDGQASLRLSTDIDYVEHANLVEIVGDTELVKVRLEASIDKDDDDQDD